MNKYKFFTLIALISSSFLSNNNELSAMEFKANKTNKSFPVQSNPNAKIPPLVKDFEDGDLLYGLHNEARDKYLSSLKVLLNKGDEHPIFITADNYNNSFVNSLNNIGKYIISTEEVCGENQACKKTAEEKIALYANYMIDLNKQNLNNINKIQQFCLNAIDFTKTTGKKIRFALDGFNCETINTGNSASYTTKELAYIYENRSRLLETVVFYRNGNITNAPWVKADDWSQDEATVCNVEFAKLTKTPYLKRTSTEEDNQQWAKIKKLQQK